MIWGGSVTSHSWARRTTRAGVAINASPKVAIFEHRYRLLAGERAARDGTILGHGPGRLLWVCGEPVLGELEPKQLGRYVENAGPLDQPLPVPDRRAALDAAELNLRDAHPSGDDLLREGDAGGTGGSGRRRSHGPYARSPR